MYWLLEWKQKETNIRGNATWQCIKLCLELYLFHPLSSAFHGEKHKGQCYSSSYECSYLSGKHLETKFWQIRSPTWDHLLLNTLVSYRNCLVIWSLIHSLFLFVKVVLESGVFLFPLLFVFLKNFSYHSIKMSVSNSLTRIFSLFSVHVKRAWKANTLPQKTYSDITPWFQLTWIIYSTSFLTVNYSAWSCYQGWWNWFIC